LKWQNKDCIIFFLRETDFCDMCSNTIVDTIINTYLCEKK